MSSKLTPRDQELLRTLLRTQLLSTAMIQQTFFPALRIARRRMAKLEERGYVTRARRDRAAIHGGPGRYGYWRLTSLGVNVVVQAYPNEYIPDGAAQRASRISLRNFEHRDAVAELYLMLVTDPKRDVNAMRERANAITWRGEYDVDLSYKRGLWNDKTGRIIPDATLQTATSRYFIELDRSTESLKRCESAMRAYSTFTEQRHRAGVADHLAPHLVYVTRSERRALNLQGLAERGAYALPIMCRPFSQAAEWLAQCCQGQADLPPVLGASRELEQLLSEVYEAARAGVGHQIATGALADAPPCLHRAFRYLNRRSGTESA